MDNEPSMADTLAAVYDQVTKEEPASSAAPAAPSASESYPIKLVLDEVFKEHRFVNEIVWRRLSAHNDADSYGKIHDTLFFYTKGDEYVWNEELTRAELGLDAAREEPKASAAAAKRKKPPKKQPAKPRKKKA